jgi:hypothetical protein
MVTRIIVLVADRDDPKHGEITVLEDRHKAERLVETLLEAGFEQERIRVFAGTALDMQIAHRPMWGKIWETPILMMRPSIPRLRMPPLKLVQRKRRHRRRPTCGTASASRPFSAVASLSSVRHEKWRVL